MLIRSQDRKRIVNFNTNNLIAIASGVGEKVRITVDGMIFGDYSTEEKAIRVLDMIQTNYERRWEVFKMPQDSEV